MADTKRKLLSIISPVYNESEGIEWFHTSLTEELRKINNFDVEIIYINDGSNDDSLKVLHSLKPRNATIQIINFSRNFGKEAALSAGLSHARGDAAIMLDSDGQHPLTLIPQFLQKWQRGADVVIGVRDANSNEGIVKRYGSKLFYPLFNRITGASLVPGSTDFRLVDRIVIDEFSKLKEHNRITRGLIDWLGYRREYIHFIADERRFGTAGYTIKKLFELAINTFVSLSAAPLYIAGYLGIVFMVIGALFGLFILIEQIILHDPLHLAITGTAMLGVLTLFLVGMILAAQGLIGVYLSRILTDGQRRPLFVIRDIKKVGK